jgi:hypothetical protein
MEGLMRKLMTIVGLAVAIVAMAASSARATTGRAMLTSHGQHHLGSNTGSVSGNSASFPAHTFQTGGATVSCPVVTVTVTAVSTTTAHFDPKFHSCQLLVSGTPVGAAAVTTPCTWTLSLHMPEAMFNDATGHGTGATVVTGCTSTVHAPAVNCEIDVAAQPVSGITTQNVNNTGDPTAVATPWGSKITSTSTGLSYVVPAGKSCPGVTSPGTNGAYTGTITIPGVWGML